ncbi:MAG: DUF2244 domain-containing protein [Bacteroidetes bacterium]|nr:DUF2244 domain-containing protein [Bacteroidota bacterium]
MEDAKHNTRLYWAITAISALALIMLTIFLPQGFWLALPTFFGGLVMAMDWV